MLELDPSVLLETALAQARLGRDEGGVPIGGALFGADGTLLGEGRNRRIQDDDPSMHGETSAFRAAGRPVSYTHLTLPTICSV